MTKFHFMKVKIRNLRDTVTELQDENGTIFTSQKMMEKVANGYWAGIMAKKTVHQEHMQTVIAKINRVLPQDSAAALNNQILSGTIRYGFYSVF